MLPVTECSKDMHLDLGHLQIMEGLFILCMSQTW